MEYVEGETLRDVLRREGYLSPERAMSLSADICGALDFSHRNGIVHRDVKPGNVMITPQGSVKVMDFGIARAVSDSAATMTSTAAVIGTAQYLSPEQARGESVDARSDVYSLGCMLYELVTGAPPFTGDSPVAVAYQHVREDPKLPSSINPQIPPELDAILLKAMSKNPANRYQSAAEMRNDLLRALAGQRVEATPVMGDAEKTTILAATPGAPYRDDDDWDDDEQERTRRKRRIIALVSVLAVLLIGGAIAIAVAMSGDDPPPATAQVTVPTLIGLPEAQARQAITDAGLVVGTVAQQETDDPAQVGTVLESTPASGAQRDEGTTVDLVVGIAPDAVTVPDVVGLDEDEARDALTEAGFTGSINTRQEDSLEEEGTVASVTPGVGTSAAPSQTITLAISSGTIDLPDVAGRPEAEARSILTQAGFSDGQITTEQVESAEPPGTVIGTTPAAGSPAGTDTRIVLQVSSGPAQPEEGALPNVRGLSPQDAQRELRAAGFTGVIDTNDGDENDPAVGVGQVIGSEPPAGSTQTLDTPITLILNPPA
jgi:serine/threonine-protein kinase